MAGTAGLGLAGRGMARHGKAGKAWRGWAGQGGARRGKAGQGGAWQGKAGVARQGVARQGVAWQGKAGAARLGLARQARRGAAWHGAARQGKAGMAWVVPSNGRGQFRCWVFQLSKKGRTTNITNHSGLPAALVRAVTNDPYTGGGDISVTKLIGPPQINALRHGHENQLTEDVADRIWSLLGQAVHTILERASESGLAETRLFMPVQGWTLSGQFDNLILLPEATLQDYKVTSAWTALEPKPEWVAQLNVLTFLCRYHSYDVRRLEVVAIYRDWSRTQAKRSKDYPQHQVAIVPIPMWAPEQLEAYVEERITLHQMALAGGVWPPCSDEERWYRGEEWAVMKEGRKSALRCLPTYEEAKQWAMAGDYIKEDGTAKAGISLAHRPGVNTRCESYCPVSAFCPQWADLRNR